MEPFELVYCAKDMGAASVTLPHAILFKESGVSVRVVVEGIAAGDYVKAGFIPDFMGTKNFKTVPFTFDAGAYLDQCFRDKEGHETPGALVIGESSPANLERNLGKILNATYRREPIFLVECQDFWAGHVRLGVVPYLVITLDEYAKQLVHQTNPHLADENVVIAGNPGARLVKVSPQVREHFEHLQGRFDRVYYYAGGGDATPSEIRLLKACLEKTHGNWCVVVGFHPKHVHEHGEKCRAILRPLGERFKEAVLRTGDQWASLTTTISGFSTVLTTATFNGQTTGVLQTKETMDSLRRESTLERVPHVALGWANAIEEIPVDLTRLEPPTEEAKAKLKPYNALIAFNAIKRLFQG